MTQRSRRSAGVSPLHAPDPLSQPAPELEQLANLDASPNADHGWLDRPGVRVVAVLLCAAAFAWGATRRGEDLQPGLAEAQRIAGELARAHLDEDAQPVSGGELADVFGALPGDIFEPRPPGGFEAGVLQVQAAWRATVGGRPAALVRFDHPEGGRFTLYQTPFDAGMRGVGGRSLDVAGLSVRFWRESDRVFALVGSS